MRSEGVISEDSRGHVGNPINIGLEDRQNLRRLPTSEIDIPGTDRRTTIPLIEVESNPAAVPSRPQDPARHQVTPTAASSRPDRARKPVINTQFFETFGGKKHDKALVAGYQKPEPKTYQKAVAGPDSRKWGLAIEAELQALMANKTWETSDLSKDRKAITYKWVFKIKYNPNETIDRYKARLVARGFTQVEGIDFDKTFALTMRFELF